MAKLSLPPHWPAAPGLLSLGAAVLVLGACTGSDGVTDPGDEDGRDWTLALSEYEGLEPGEVVVVGVEGDYPENAVIWVDPDTEDWYWVPLLRPLRGPSTRDRLQLSLPIMVPGEHELRVGTPSGPRSNPVRVEVVSPPRRYSREEAAALLEEGLAAMATGAWALLSADDSVWTPFRDEILGEEVWADLEEWYATAPEAARVVEDVYREIPPEVELPFQAYLHNAGILPLLAEMAGAGVAASAPAGAAAPGAPTSAAGPLAGPTPVAGAEPPVPVLRYLPHSPHRELFMMDMWLAGMHGMDATLTIASILGAGAAPTFPPGGLLAVVASTGAKYLVRMIRAAVEIGVPTDLVSVEPHHQVMVYEDQRIRELWWGHVRPEQRLGEGIASLTVDLATAGLLDGWGAATNDSEIVTEAVGELLARISTRVPALGLLSIDFQGDYAVEAKTAINPGAYTLATPGGLAEVAGLASALGGPGAAPAVPLIVSSASLLWLMDATVGLPERGLTARSLDGSAPASAAAGGFDVEYWTDEIYFPPVDFPDGGPSTAQVEIRAHTFNIAGKGIPFGPVTFFGVPWLYPLDPVGHPIQVNDWEGAEDDAKPFNGRSFIFNSTIDPEATLSRRWAIEGDDASGHDRHFRFSLYDAHPCVALDNVVQTVDLTFNDSYTTGDRTRLEGLELSLVSEVLDVWAHPGLTSIDVRAPPGCALPTSQGYTVWVVIHFPGSMNQVPRTVELTADETVSRRIHVWTPPCFEPCGGRR